MHIEIRLFPGLAGQAGRLTARRSELTELLGGMPELVTFELAETREGLALVVVAGEAGVTAECCRRAAAWVATRLPELEWQDAFSVSGAVIGRLER